MNGECDTAGHRGIRETNDYTLSRRQGAPEVEFGARAAVSQVPLKS